MVKNKNSVEGEYGECLRKIRKSVGLTLDEASKISGISKQYIWELEVGKKDNPSMNILKRISNAYGVKINDIFDERKTIVLDGVLYELTPITKQKERKHLRCC